MSVEELCHESPELIGTIQGALREQPTILVGVKTEIVSPRTEPPEGETVAAGQGEQTEGFIESDEPAPEPEILGQLGSYRVIKLLGAGGMGAVFQAIDDKLGRQVALKVLRPSLAHDPNAQERFLREARAAAALEHDHIVTIFQVGEERGIPFLAMPLLAGMSLETRLRAEGRLPVGEVLRIGREIAEGLDAAHSRKVIHRDIKPANIWLEGERGRVKILDFGLARATDEAHRLTREDTILGTPAYMAPEQATNAKEIDARLDLFSLGAVLYKIATGRVPFAGAGAVQTLVVLVKTDPTPPREINPEIPPALNELILQLLAKQPADRPVSARAVVEAIREIEVPSRDELPLIRLDRPEQPRTHASARPARRTSWLIGGVVALVLLALFAFALPVLIATFDDKGRLTIDTPLPYALVVVKQSGQQVAVIDPTRQTTVALWPGSYDLSLEGDHSGLKLASDRISLRRGDRVIVRVVPEADLSVAESRVVATIPIAELEEPPGLIPRPEPIAALGRWQIETRLPRSVIRSLAWSPNRRRLACVAEHERAVRIYDSEGLSLVGLLVGHNAPILGVVWSPVGHQLATVSLDGTVRLWSTDGTPGAVFMTPDVRPLCVAWGPEGRWLATGGSDGIVRIWGRDGSPVRTFDGHNAGVTAVAWSPDGQHLVSGTAQGQVQLWEIVGKRGPVFEGDTHPVLSLSWSADGRWFAAGGQSGARIWTSTGAAGPELEDAPGSISCLAWSPKDPTLAAACLDGTVRCWNDAGQPGAIMVAETSAQSAPQPTSGLGQGTPGVITLAWSPDGKRLASAGHDGAVRQWAVDGTPGPVLSVALSRFKSLAWSPDGKKLVSDFPLDHSLRIWDTDRARGQVLKGNEGSVNAVAWSPDGRSIAAGNGADTVRLWSADGTPGRLFQESGAITSIAWSPDSRRLAAGCYNNTVHVFGVDEDAPHLDVVLNGHTAHVLCVAWSPDGKRLASGGYDCTVRLWDMGDSKPSSIVLGKLDHRVEALAWSPDGELLASASHDGHVRMWTMKDPAASPLVLKGHDAAALTVCWSPDGRRLASGGADGTVRLWSVDGTPGPILVSHGGPVNSVAWSAEGRRLASANDVGTIRIWTVAGLQLERVLVPTSAHKVALLDRKGRVISSTPGAESDLIAYQVSPQGSVILVPLHEFQKTSGATVPRDSVKSRKRAATP